MALEDLRVLNRMCNVYNIEPKSEHYGFMVDLFSRAGFLEEAKEIIERMPSSRTSFEEAIAWRALLTVFCNQGQARLAEVATERLLRLEVHNGAYVLLSNFYPASGKYDDAKRIRKVMRHRGVDKTTGCSSIKVDGTIDEFVARETKHPHMDEIASVLEMSKHLTYLGTSAAPNVIHPAI